MSDDRRQPRAVRLSAADVALLKRAARKSGQGWTAMMRGVALAYARRVLAPSDRYVPVRCCPHCGRKL